MRHAALIIPVIMILISFEKKGIALKQNCSVNSICLTRDTTKKQVPGNKKNNKEEKWISFWKDFTTAIYTKDKKRIAELTSKDFYDGAGGTVDQWLDAEVYLNDQHFNGFKNTLKKGVRNFKGYEGNPYKATGKNSSGDLYFEYKNNQWLFGGIVGD